MTRVLICVDMEGILGIVNWGQCTPGDPAWLTEGRPRMARETLLVATEAAAHFDEVVIMDAHWLSTNLDASTFAHLPNVRLVQGDLFEMTMVPDVENCDALIQIGLHGRHGAPGVLSHNIVDAKLTLDGRIIGETSLNGLAAAGYGVPTLLVSGDEAACEEARETLGGVITVATKVGLADGGYRERGPEVHDELVAAVRLACTRPLPAPVALGPGDRTLTLSCPRSGDVLFESTGRTVGECYFDLLAQMNLQANLDATPAA